MKHFKAFILLLVQFAICNSELTKEQVLADFRATYFSGQDRTAFLTAKQKDWFASLAVPSTDSLPRIRREIRSMTDDERSRLFTAFNAMKQSIPDPEDPTNEYDVFTVMHAINNSPAAHFGAAFLPWHREYLFRMEEALVRHGAPALPYWDSTLDHYLPEPDHSVLWTEEILGNLTPEDPVVNVGPFAFWKVTDNCKQDVGGDFLVRQTDDLPSLGLLYDDNEVELFQNHTEYIQIICLIDCELENLHGGPHAFVEGQMSVLFCSPSDPVFYMHHAFLDWQWENFRQNSQITDPELEYPTMADGNIGGPFHEPFATMIPFGIPNIHGIGNHYTNYYYRYDARPFQCENTEDCGSRFLWCDIERNRCSSRVFPGGVCGNSPNDICYGDDFSCIDGICANNMNLA